MPSRVSWKKDFIPLKVVSSSRCSDLKDPTCFSLLWICSFFSSRVPSCWTSPSLRSKNRLNLCVHWCRRNPFNTLFKYTVAWQYLLTLHCQKPDYFATILQKLQDTFNCVWHVTALTLQCLVATPPICIKLSVSHCFDTLTSCSALLSVLQSPAQVWYSAPVENELKMLHSLCFSGLVHLDRLQVQE